MLMRKKETFHDIDGLLDSNGFDRLDVIIRKHRFIETDEPWLVCDLYINGKSLIKMIRKKEKRFVFARKRSLGYAGLPPENALLPENATFIDTDDRNLYLSPDGRVQTVVCDACGEADCNTIPVRITVTDSHVLWTEIGTPETKIGPFTFDRRQYEQVLDYKTAFYRSAYFYSNGIYVRKNKKMMQEMLEKALLAGQKGE